MDKNEKILIVEDSLPEGMMLLDILEDENYEVFHAINANQGIQSFIDNEYNLVLLDVMLPDKNGFQIAKQIKAINQDVPIIFLTSKKLKSDEIEGFSTGADDYLTKPYDRELLLWRIKAVLKRHKRSTINISEKYQLGTYRFDRKNQTISRENQSISLTKRESDILQLLCTKMNQIVSREDILFSFWGDSNYFNSRSLDVFISKLRKYFKYDLNVTIENVHGVGFKLYCKNNTNND